MDKQPFVYGVLNTRKKKNNYFSIHIIFKGVKRYSTFDVFSSCGSTLITLMFVVRDSRVGQPSRRLPSEPVPANILAAWSIRSPRASDHYKLDFLIQYMYIHLMYVFVCVMYASG